MVCLPTGTMKGASCVLFYQSGRRSRHPRAPSTGKTSTLSCEFLLFSRTNSRALGKILKLPAEERLECLVQIGHDVLEDVAVDVQCVGAGGLLDLDLAKLHGLGDRLASLLVSLLALATTVVVEVAARLAHGFQPFPLALAGIQAIDERLEHSKPPRLSDGRISDLAGSPASGDIFNRVPM